MRETVFNSEVIKSLKRAGVWAYKIPDQPTSWTMKRTRFTPEKPCDILFCSGGLFGAIEGKQMKKFQAFGLYSLRPSQIVNLRKILEVGGRAYVFLNVRIAGSGYENRLIILDWATWGDLLEICPLSAKEVKALPFIRGRNGLYDLKGFFQEFAKNESSEKR